MRTSPAQQRYDRQQMLIVHRMWANLCKIKGRRNDFEGEQKRLEQSERNWQR